MKKRLEKKAEKLRRKKIHEILDIVLDINTTRPRLRSVTGEKPTAMFDFSGHTSGVEVQVFEHGWSSGAERKSFYGYSTSISRYDYDYVYRRSIEEKELLKSVGQM